MMCRCAGGRGPPARCRYSIRDQDAFGPMSIWVKDPYQPMPMKPMPAARQTARVAPTVVAPSSFATAQAARSRGPTLRASGDVAKRSSSPASRPTQILPSMTPTVAGTAQATRFIGKVEFTTKIWKPLAFRAGFTARYNNAPALTTAFKFAPDFAERYNQPLDTLTELGFVVNFL